MNTWSIFFFSFCFESFFGGNRSIPDPKYYKKNVWLLKLLYWYYIVWLQKFPFVYNELFKNPKNSTSLHGMEIPSKLRLQNTSPCLFMFDITKLIVSRIYNIITQKLKSNLYIKNIIKSPQKAELHAPPWICTLLS